MDKKRILLISALPEKSPYLKDVSDEIWQIAAIIFGGQRSSIDNEFDTNNWGNVDETKLFEALKFNPDIIHFAGHGDKDGILLDNGTEHGKSISAEELNLILSGNNKKFELIFLNSCFSENQAEELKKHSEHVIAIKGEIEQGMARVFAENFYKEYKETKDVVKSYQNTMLKDKINYRRIRELQKLYPEDKFIDQTLEDAVGKLCPFEKTIKDFDIKIIQSKKIPAVLESRIRQVIRNHDESAIKIEKLSDLKKEFKDIYEILFELILTGSEYGINRFFIKSGDLVQHTKMIKEKILKELENKEVLNDKDMKEYKQIYDDTVSRFFKKIFYNLEVDHIENIEPMVPKDSNYSFFGEIVDIMHSILKSLSIMRGKTKQLFLITNTFHRNYVIKRLYGFITYIEYDSKYLTQLLWEELHLDINDPKSEDQENFSTLVWDLKSLWQNIQQNKKSSSIIKINLDNTINIEEKLVKLFRRIIFSSLEYDYNTPINIDTKSEAFKREIKPAINQNEVKSYDSDYTDLLAKLGNDLYDTPAKFFKILDDLINKMNEQYEICYNKFRCNEEDIKPLKEMYEKLNLQKTYLTDYSGKYQYLFSEIAELCDIWNSRIDSLWKKNVRQDIKQITLSFSEAKYNDVLKIFDGLPTFSHSEDYVKTNTRLLNKVGVAYFNLEKYNEAYNTFKKILKIDENNNNALFNLGLTLQKFEEKSTIKRKYESVIEQFHKLIEKDHTNINAHTALSMIYFKNGQYDHALEYIEKAIQLSEKPNWRTLLVKGCILRDGKEDYNNAKKFFDQAEDENPNSVVVKLNKCQNILLNPQSEEKDAPLRILKEINVTLKNFEDRSTKIITKILLLYSKYLDGNKFDYELLQELLVLFSLKDSKLVMWNFKKLEELVKQLNIPDEKTAEERDLLLKIFSIPGTKSLEEFEMKKKIIQSFLNKSQTSKIEYIPNEDNNIKSDCKIIKEIKKDKMEIEKGDVTSFYVWEITVEIKDQVNSKFFDTLKEIRFTFDPTFDEHKQIFPITKQRKKFSVKAIGWDSTKLEIAFDRTDGSLLKQVIQL